MTNSVWRLIPLLSASGRVQMAIDKWLLEKHLAGKNPPTLRFYTWVPAAISLGYHQQRWPDFWQQLSWEGKPLELVRRPSGGRAVLHQGDLIDSFASRPIAAADRCSAVLGSGWCG